MGKWISSNCIVCQSGELAPMYACVNQGRADELAERLNAADAMEKLLRESKAFIKIADRCVCLVNDVTPGDLLARIDAALTL